MAATIAVPPLAKPAAEVIMALVNGEAVPQMKEKAPELVTIANASEMYRRHIDRPFGRESSE